MLKKLTIISEGFSLIELMVVMALIGVMATQLPRLVRPNRDAEKKLITQLNSLAQHAYTYALMGGKATQLFFEFGDHATPRKVSIRQESAKKDPDQKPVFEIIASEFGNDSFEWDQQFKVERFVIDNKDEAAGAGNLKTLWFYISPSGLAQQVTIALRNTETNALTELQLNPFFVQFKVV